MLGDAGKITRIVDCRDQRGEWHLVLGDVVPVADFNRIDAHLIGDLIHHRGTSNDDRFGDILCGNNRSGSKDLFFFALREDDTLGLFAGRRGNPPHDAASGAELPLQAMSIFLDIHRMVSDATIHGRSGYRGRDPA